MLVNIHTHKPLDGELTIRTAGIHPWEAASVPADASAGLDLSDADAIGETGLDFACDVDRNAQESVFHMQLQLAQQAGLPVVIHCVRAFEPVMKILAEYRLPAVIFHGFIGSAEQAQRAVGAGYHLSFGERSFASPKTVEAMKNVPRDRMFFETDESDTPIGKIYETAAQLLKTEASTLAHSINDNYDNIFGK